MDLVIFYSCFSEIADIIKYGKLSELNADSNLVNNSNDLVKEMDLIAHNIIVKSLKEYNNIIGFVSEESQSVEFLKEPFTDKPNYIMAFDPIDGSKNLLSNITVGTIYCLYEYDHINNKLTNIVEAGYCLYGPRVTLVRTHNNKVEAFLLNKHNNFEKEGELSFSVNKEKLYAINQSNRYSNEINELIKNYRINNYNQRWVGSMVADCHQILSKGGIFMYPSSEKYPNGKLRLLYEVIPFSYIFKIAGGIGIDLSYSPILDKFSIYDLNTLDLHKPIPIILASKEEYNKMLSYLDIVDDIFC